MEKYYKNLLYTTVKTTIIVIILVHQKQQIVDWKIDTQGKSHYTLNQAKVSLLN